MEHSNQLLLELEKLTEEQFRSNIERIIKSYRHTWDIYAELLQNAVDAVVERFPASSGKDGLISLKINTKDREVEVTDNGVGIPADKLVGILVNGESLKRRAGTGKYGFMGFGLTFVAFQSSFIQISTVHDGLSATVTYLDLYKSIFGTNPIPRSEEEKRAQAPEETEKPAGTTVKVRFPAPFSEDTIEQILLETFDYPRQPELFEAVLRTRTVVGCTNELFGEKPLFAFDLEVDGIKQNVEPSYLRVREVVMRTLKSDQMFYNIDEDYPEVIRITSKMDEGAAEIARRSHLLDGVYHNQRIGIAGALAARIYCAATSKEHLNKFDAHIKATGGHNSSLEYRNGVWLAIDGMPTGICIDAFEHSSFLPYTALVDVTSPGIRKDLDAGRKGITDYRIKQICELVRKILTEHNFFKYRRYVVGADARISDPLYKPREELLKLRKTKSEQNIPICNRWLPPREEQEVIALFVELMSRAVIIGYTPQIMAGYEVYDGLFDYRLGKELATVFSQDNTLGIYEELFDKSGGILHDPTLLIEFKRDLSGLLWDIDKRKKDVNHIDVLVVWNEEEDSATELNRSRGCILRKRNHKQNPYFGVTHELIVSSRQNPLPIISLRYVMKLQYGIPELT